MDCKQKLAYLLNITSYAAASINYFLIRDKMIDILFRTQNSQLRIIYLTLYIHIFYNKLNQC